MKIGLFADPHYCQFNNGARMSLLSYEKIEKTMIKFKEEKVDLCICLGDLVDTAPGDTKEDVLGNLRKIIGLISSFGIRYYIVPGNHDYLDLTSEELERETKNNLPPHIIGTKDKTLIFLDANYRSDMRKFDVAGVEWTDSNLPKEQIEYLKKALDDSEKECIVFVHENLDRTIDKNHTIKNANDICKIIEESKKVKLVIQGHYHKGADNIINGIRYLTLPALCEKSDNYYMILDI